MRFVILEVPDREDLRFLKFCIADCLARYEAPFVLERYAQALVTKRDVPKALQAAIEIASRADATIVYTNFGITPAMNNGIRAAEEAGRPIEYRVLKDWRGRHGSCRIQM